MWFTLVNSENSLAVLFPHVFVVRYYIWGYVCQQNHRVQARSACSSDSVDILARTAGRSSTTCAPRFTSVSRWPATPCRRVSHTRTSVWKRGRGLCCVISPPRAPQVTDPAVRFVIRTSSVFNFKRDDRWRMYRREITIYSAAIQLKNQLLINAFMCIGYFKVRSSVTNGC